MHSAQRFVRTHQYTNNTTGHQSTYEIRKNCTILFPRKGEYKVNLAK